MFSYFPTITSWGSHMLTESILAAAFSCSYQPYSRECQNWHKCINISHTQCSEKWWRHDNFPHLTGFLFCERIHWSTRVWCILCCQPEQNVIETIQWLVIHDVVTLMWRHFNATTLQWLVRHSLKTLWSSFALWLAVKMSTSKEFEIDVTKTCGCQHRQLSPLITVRDLRYVSTYAERQRGGYSVFMLCVSGSEAVRRRVSAAGPQEWALEPFSAPPCGAVAVWRQMASSLLKHRRYGIDIKNTPIALKLDRRIYCCAADQPVKIQTDWRTTSVSRLRDFTESYDKTS